MYFFYEKKNKETLINIGTGKDFTIKEYANILLKIINPNRKIKILFDKTKPNGTPRKVLNINLAKKYGWQAKTNIEQAIRITYQDYLKKTINKQLLYLYNFNFLEYKAGAGDYCEGVIPDPIPNSEVKPFCANGTLS